MLAGLRPSAGSPLVGLTQGGAWQGHADRFNAMFSNVENRQLKRIRAWSSAKLKDPSPVLFYMFSGPDFLEANAFFPNATTYVMAGLEPTGPIPDLTKASRESLASGMRGIEVSLRSLLQKAIKAYLNRGPNLRHGIALDKQVTIILSQTEKEGERPLCGIYFNLHSPYQKKSSGKTAKAQS